MYFKSKTISLVLLALTALVCSRVMFLFFNDPEGPNLLIVTVLAAILYGLSVTAYLLYPATKLTGLKRLLVVILIQILLVTGLYFALR